MEKYEDKVSVIIPVYNCEKFLPHTLTSVLNQSFDNWEAVVVNDASTDDSEKIIRDFAARDKRIHLINMEKNAGVGACRNKGMAQATGRYLAFLDADDLWSKEKLARQLDFMRQKNAGASHTAFAFMSENGEVLTKGKVAVDEKIDMKQYMKTTQIGMSTVMIDRDKIPDLRFPEEREVCEDARAWMELFRKGHHFYGLNDVLLLYRVRQNQLSRNKIQMAANTLKRYLREDNLPACKRLFYFLNYACNGVIKRLNKTELPPEVVRNFNCQQKDAR